MRVPIRALEGEENKSKEQGVGPSSIEEEAARTAGCQKSQGKDFHDRGVNKGVRC